MQVVAALLVSTKRVDEAEPYLVKLLGAEGVNVENGFLQLNRLLAANPDKAANLRVVRNLAARYPQLASAHFAVAQAASIAGDDAAALESIRRAQKLRPEWETAAIFEAQVLQKRSPAEAAKRLGEFVEKNPASREARIGYARVLVLDKRYPEARKQFEALLAASPGNAEVVYAVGLLAFQLKDYPVAEENMKRLLGMGYRDPNGVRYVLGQIAEEQKQWPQAIKWYDSILDGDQVIAARVRSAGAIAKQGKLDEARILPAARQRRESRRARAAHGRRGAAAARRQPPPRRLRSARRGAEGGARPARAAVRLRAHRREARALRRARVEPQEADRGAARPCARLQRARLLVRRPQHRACPRRRKLIEKALELSPDDYFIIDSLGWVLYREGDLKGAADQLRRAYAGRPDAEIGAHLGEVLWVLGERDEADRIWQESLKASPENETLQKTIKRLKKK